MIFVTVGTHEQPFYRLVKKIDEYIGKNNIPKNKVFIQLGYTDYLPENCGYKNMLSYEEMNNLYLKSEIIITHGGPGSMFLPWKYGKKVIAVPRLSKYKEHVDDHQLKFCKLMESENKVICIGDEINKLDVILTDLILNNTNGKVSEIGNYEPKTDEFLNKFKSILQNELGV